MDHEDRKHLVFCSFYCLLFPFHNRKSMFAVLNSDIDSFKSGLLHLTGQPYCKKSSWAKVKDGIINLMLISYRIFTHLATQLHLAMMQWLRAQTIAPLTPFPLWPLGHKKSRSLSGLKPLFNISRYSLMSTSKNCLYFVCTTDI